MGKDCSVIIARIPGMRQKKIKASRIGFGKPEQRLHIRMIL